MKGLMDLLGKEDAETPTLKATGDNTSTESALENEGDQPAFEAAAQDCYQALKAGDASGFRDALQVAIEMIK